MKRRKNKKNHSHNSTSKIKENKKQATLQTEVSQTLKQIAEESSEEIRKKHKHKKGQNKKLSFWDGLILFLLLKENGILDELLEEDAYKEFDSEEDVYKEFNPETEFNTKINHFKNRRNDYMDFDYISED